MYKQSRDAICSDMVRSCGQWQHMSQLHGIKQRKKEGKINPNKSQVVVLENAYMSFFQKKKTKRSEISRKKFEFELALERKKEKFISFKMPNDLENI